MSQLADDVAAASASLLVNVLPGLLGLPPPALFERLKLHIEAALMAYDDGREAWDAPEPSAN